MRNVFAIIDVTPFEIASVNRASRTTSASLGAKKGGGGWCNTERTTCKRMLLNTSPSAGIIPRGCCREELSLPIFCFAIFADCIAQAINVRLSNNSPGTRCQATQRRRDVVRWWWCSGALDSGRCLVLPINFTLCQSHYINSTEQGGLLEWFKTFVFSLSLSVVDPVVYPVRCAWIFPPQVREVIVCPSKTYVLYE